MKKQFRFVIKEGQTAEGMKARLYGQLQCPQGMRIADIAVEEADDDPDVWAVEVTYEPSKPSK